MRFHAPLCILPPCASPLPVSWPHQRPDVIPGQPSQPVCVILHAPGPAARSFLSPFQVLPMRTAIALFSLRQALCAPVPLRSDFPPTESPLPRHTPPCGDPARQTDIMPNRKWAPPLPCLPDLSLPVEHRHIALPCHYASPPGRLPSIKRRGRKAGASLPPASAAVPRITDLVSGCT